MGYLYKQKHPPKGKTYAEAKADGTLHESSVWWVKYYDNGRPVRESTGSEKETEAKRSSRTVKAASHPVSRSFRVSIASPTTRSPKTSAPTTRPRRRGTSPRLTSALPIWTSSSRATASPRSSRTP